MEIAPTLSAVVFAQRELTLRQIGINVRHSVQVAQVRALDRLINSAFRGTTRNMMTVPVNSTRGQNLDISV